MKLISPGLQGSTPAIPLRLYSTAMLRVVQRSPSLQVTGYVCHSCRHHLRQHRRYESTATPTAEEAGAGKDDWFSNFNSLGTPTHRVGGQGEHASAAVTRRRRGATKNESLQEGTPRTRLLAPNHPALQSLNHKPTEALEHHIRRFQNRLKRARPPSNDTSGNAQVVEPVAARSPRKTAFTRPVPMSTKDYSALCGEIALRQRAIELRHQGSLKEPERRAPRERLLPPLPQMSMKKLEANLQVLKDEITTRERQREPQSSDIVEPVQVSATAPRATAFSRPAMFRRSSLGDLRSMARLYEKSMEKRRSGAFSGPVTVSSLENSGRQSGQPQTAASVGRRAKQARQSTDKASGPTLDSVIAGLKRDTIHQVQSSGTRTEGTAVENPVQHDIPTKASTQSVSASPGRTATTRKASSASGMDLNSLRQQLEKDTMIIDTSPEKREAASDVAYQQLQTTRQDVAASSQPNLRQSMPSFERPDHVSAFLAPQGGPRPTIAQRAREARDRPKWGGIALKGKHVIDDGHTNDEASERGGTQPQTQDSENYAAYFADSPADLAESQSILDIQQPNVKKKPAEVSSISSQDINDLRQSLGSAIRSKDHELSTGSRERLIEQNIKDYSHVEQVPRSADKSANASESLANLYGAPKTAQRTEHGSEKGSGAAKEDAGESEPTKPARKGGRKNRRNIRAEKKRSTIFASPASPSNVANDDGDDGEHKPLWKAMGSVETATPEIKQTDASKEHDAETAPAEPPLPDVSGDAPPSIASVKAGNLHINALNIPQPPVPGLQYGLDKVLFNSGVYQLQDPTSRVYNFDPYLQDIMPAVEFDFNALKEYKTSSEDQALSAIAKEQQKKYMGSTSSMTGTLAHFHYLLSNWRPLNLSMFSRGFGFTAEGFTKINKAPNAIFLRWKPKSKTYAIDADKEFDGANVLMMLGKSMEKLLTLPTSEFEKYRKSDPREVSHEAREEPEAFEYTTMGDFLMRSQLDAYDARLPGNGMFDLKTRAVLSIRMDAEDFEPMLGYELHTLQGSWFSYEREYYDMMRATMLKYMLQARMGRMQGIFAAYHNIQRMFGFQYIPIMEMDRALHGQIDPCLGDQEFKLSLELLNKVLDKATAKFPEQSLRLHFETGQQMLGGSSPQPVMSVFAEPMTEKAIREIQNASKEKVREFERKLMGIEDKEQPGDQAPTEYPPATPEPESQEEPATSAEEEDGEDTPPTEYPPATPEPPSTSPTASDPNLTSSSSAADSSFLSSLSNQSEKDIPPLFTATLMAKSRVNDRHVQRPEGLKPDDDWTVEYLLTEYPASEATWARYEAAKGRRKEVLVRERDEDEDVSAGENGGGEGKATKKRDGFIEMLRDMAKKGREYRAEVDAKEKGVEKKFAWKQPSTPVGGAAVTEEVGEKASTGGDVEDVGGYMSWLYQAAGRKE